MYGEGTISASAVPSCQAALTRERAKFLRIISGRSSANRPSAVTILALTVGLFGYSEVTPDGECQKQLQSFMAWCVSQDHEN
jgi:hypothetical protein